MKIKEVLYICMAISLLCLIEIESLIVKISKGFIF